MPRQEQAVDAASGQLRIRRGIAAVGQEAARGADDCRYGIDARESISHAALDPIAVAEQRIELVPTIAAFVMESFVVSAPEIRMSRHGRKKDSSGPKYLTNTADEDPIGLDVLDHIERRNDVEGIGPERNCLGVGADEPLNAPAPRETQCLAREVETEGRSLNPGALKKHPRTAPDIEEPRPGLCFDRRIPAQNPPHKSQPALEPPVAILQLEHALIFFGFHAS